MRGNSCQVERNMKQWKRLPQEVWPHEERKAKEAQAFRRYRWFPSKGRGRVSQGWTSRRP